MAKAEITPYAASEQTPWPDPEVVDPILDTVRRQEGYAGEDYVMGMASRHGRQTFARILHRVEEHHRKVQADRELGRAALSAAFPRQLALFD